MSHWFFRIAALLCVVTILAHEFLGAPLVLPPLAAPNIAEEVRWLHHFSWHVGTVSTLAMAGMFLYASIRPGNTALAVVATLMCAGFAIVGTSLAIFGSSALWSSPAPYVWWLVMVVGLVGVYLSE